MGCSKRSSKRELDNNSILPQEARKISSKQPNLTPKKLEEDEQTKPKVSRKKS